MATEDFGLSAVLKLNPSQLSAGLNSAANKINSFASRGATAVQSLATRLQSVAAKFNAVAEAARRSGQVVASGLNSATKAATGLATAAGAAGVAMTNLASDANEAASKFQFVFGEAAGKTGKSLDEFAKAAGRSRYELKSMAADVGALLNPMGFTKEKTGELSVAVAKLTTDLSSFFNVSESDALIALRAAIVGESEPMRRLGVTLNEAKIEQEALRLGLIKTKKEMDSQAKATAILSIVFRETQQAQGDAIRTGDQLANSWRRMTSFVKDAATDLGQAFIPAVTKYVRAAGDAALKAAKWAQANRELLAQKLAAVMDKIGTSASGVGKALARLYDRSGPVIDAMKRLHDGLMKWFDALPKGAQNTIKVAGAMTLLGVGLKEVGGSIPIVGQFAGALGDMINPLKLIRGLVAVIIPMLGVAFGPVTLTVGVASAAIYGLYKAFQKLYEVSESFREGWDGLKAAVSKFVDYVKAKIGKWVADHQRQFDRITDKINKSFDRLKGAIGRVIDLIGEKLGNALSTLSRGSIKDLDGAMDALGAAAGKVLDVFEGLLDFLNGDGRRLGTIGIDIAKMWNTAVASMLDSIASLMEKVTEFVGNPKVKAFLLVTNPALAASAAFGVSPEDITGNIAKRARGAASNLRSKNDILDVAAQITRKSIEHDDAKRNESIDRRRRVSKQTGSAAASGAAKGIGAVGRGIGAVIGLSENVITGVVDRVEQAKLQFDQTHSEQVAQAQKSINNNLQNNAPKSSSQMMANFLSGGASNVKTAMQGQNTVNQTVLGMVRGSVTGKMSGAEQGGYNSLMALGQQIMQEMSQVSKLQGAAQKQQIDKVTKLNDLFQKLGTAVANGDTKLSDLAKEIEKTTKDMGALDQKQQAQLAHAQGKLSPQEQQMQQVQQEFAQQVGNWFQQQGQQAFDQAKQTAQQSAQAMMEQAIGGPAQVQGMIDQAAATGNMKDAVRLIRSRAEAQLEQSQLNLHALAIGLDPNAGGMGGMSGVTNESYLMSLDIPIVQTIKYLQNLLAGLPKMASGGIVTGPSNVIVGESGPEAVLPLNNFWNMMGSLPVFTGIRNALETLGTWFSQGPLPGMFQYGGNNQALASRYFASLSKIQHTYEYGMDRLWNSRYVNLTPASMMGAGGGYSYAAALASDSRMAYGPGRLPFGVGGYAGPMQPGYGGMVSGMSSLVGQMNLHFNGTDITVPGAAQRFAEQLLPALNAAVTRAGYSMGGRSPFMVAGSAARPVGYAR